MASLVAYDDSDSEAEAEPAGSVNAPGQMKDASGVATSPRQDFTSGIMDVTNEGAQGTEYGPYEDPGEHRLPLVRLWRRDPGSCPSQRLRWPVKEPEVTFPTSEPSRPSSLWTCCAPAGHMPLAAARLKQVRLSWESPEPSFCSPNRSEATGKNAISFQRKRCEDCVVPYTPKRLRQLQAFSTETGQKKDMELQSPSVGCAPSPLCVTPRVSELIQPYLNSQCRETRVPRTVLFHLRGHRGPVNSIQWCPVPSRSHMLLSTSMDKTFKMRRLRTRGGALKDMENQAESWPLNSAPLASEFWNCSRHLPAWKLQRVVMCLWCGTLWTRGAACRPTPCTARLCGLPGGLPAAGASSVAASTLPCTSQTWKQVVRGYKATIQQTLDILFLQEGSEFLSSTDASTRDSADRTIIAWDFRTSAKISNQIFHERYTCPSLALHPREPVFLAQTNGNYLALFSAVWPYRMSRRRRYEGHKVEGYAVGCECSPCGDLLVTGSADGRVLMFSFRTASRACTLQGHTQACVGTTYHPVLPSVLGTCSWGGDIKIWH
ncbi:WD repeat-containing protein 25 isoform 3-T4 [Callospermophilus lateralis]